MSEAHPGIIATHADMVAQLRAACAGGQRAFARKHGIAESDISAVLHGNREVTEPIANALGYMRRLAFYKIAKREAA